MPPRQYFHNNQVSFMFFTLARSIKTLCPISHRKFNEKFLSFELNSILYPKRLGQRPSNLTDFVASSCLPCSPDVTNQMETRHCIWAESESTNSSCIVKESSKNSEACDYVNLTRSCIAYG